MIQDIHPHLFDNTYQAITRIEENDYVYHFIEDSLLLKQLNGIPEIPCKQELDNCPDEGIFLFSLNNKRCFWVTTDVEISGDSFIYHPIKFPHTLSQSEIDWTSAVAFQLKNWYEQHRFCGKCGSKTKPKRDERAIECSQCNHLVFPTLSPAIIVAILSGDKILLARGAQFQEKFFSLIAGYLDIGETVEEAVIREVKEEVGLSVKNIRNYKSQPWPFSGSIMLGFIAELEGDENVKIDGKEIVEANWYPRNALPNFPSTRSIAGEILELFRKGEL